MIEREEQLEGRRLDPDSTFRFRCRPGLACFNSCCHNKRLSLLPYDLLRLRRALALPSQEILERFVELEIDPSSGWPLLRLGLGQDGRCRFVGPEGCTVYPHRPTCCRIFPLARAVASDGAELFLAPSSSENDSACRGWREPHELTVRDYLEEQGLPPYREANNRVARLFMHPARPGSGMTFDAKQTHAVIMALYNLDVFREAVAAPGFAARFGLEDGRVDRARESDEALLDLGQDWLTALLFAP